MTQSAAKPLPDNMHSLTPHLVCAGGLEAIDFYQKAFGATVVRKLIGPKGELVHAGLRIGDSMLLIAEECPEWGSLGPKSLNGSPVVIHLMVDDVDASFARAVEAGAKVTMPVADMFWGDRYGQLVDPFGHRWSLATHVRDLSNEELQDAMMTMFSSPPA